MVDSISYPVEIPAAGRTIPGYLAEPQERGRHPAVVVIQDRWGMVDHHKEVLFRLARAGYVALAPDLYHGQPARSVEEAQASSGRLWDSAAMRDLQAGIDFLRGLEIARPDRIGSVGFCMGGRLAILLAGSTRDLAASAIFYGNVYNHERQTSERQPHNPIEVVPHVTAPVLGLFGEADAQIPMEDVRDLEAALQRHGKAFEIHSYPGAGHGFTNHTEARFHPEATADAWTKLLAFYEHHLGA